MSDSYEVHCMSCGSIEMDEQGQPERFPFGQWYSHITECSECGATPCDEAGITSILVAE